MNKGQSWLFWVFMAGMAVILCAPGVVNHSEAEDAYDYAKDVRELEYQELLHPNHRIYHIVAKAIYEASGSASSFEVLVVLSMVCGVLALWGFDGLLRDVGVSSLSSRCFLVACLAASYGFWRYTHEVEVYALGWLVLVLVLRLLFRVQGWVGGVLLAVAIVFAVNIHRALGPPILVMALVYLGSERDWRALVTGLVVGGMLYLGTEELASRISVPRVAEVSALQQLAGGVDGEGAIGWVHLENRVGWSSLPRAVIGFGATVMGGLLVMGFDGPYEFLQYRLFPFRFLTEERWLAEGVSDGHRVWWVVLALVTVAGFVWFGLRTVSRRVFWEERSWRKLVLPFGMACYAAMVAVFEPGNPEMWLLGLPLFWGACGALLPVRVGWGAMVLPVLLGMTNYVGGVQLLGDHEKDYHWVTARQVMREAESDDLYLLDARNISQKGYVEYHRDIEVVRVWGKLDDAALFYEAVAGELRRGRGVFVHESLARRAGGFGLALSEAGLEFIECEDCAGGGRLELRRES